MLINKILTEIEKQKPRKIIAKQLIDIFDGSLLNYVEQMLKIELSNSAYEASRHRIPPINILTKLVEKLSGLYNHDILRTLEIQDKNEQALIEYYKDKLELDDNMQLANDMFAFLKTALVQVYYSDKHGVSMRLVPENSYYVYSSDKDDRTNLTHVIICNGFYKKREINCERFIIYTDSEVLYIDADGDSYQEATENPYNKLPFVYINRSRTALVPQIDLDLLKMAVLIPALLADLNFAIKFQSFSIIALIDADVSNLKMSPSAIWNIKSIMQSERQASIQSIKPQVDIDQVSKHILSQLSMWLNTKGLKSRGITGASNDMSSAISKLVDESDVSDQKKKMAKIFKRAEKKLWDLILKNIHPVLIQNNLIENKTIFNFLNNVTIKFQENTPMFQRKDLIASIKEELSLGIISLDTAMRRANPDYTEEQLMAEKEKIKSELSLEVNLNDNQVATN